MLDKHRFCMLSEVNVRDYPDSNSSAASMVWAKPIQTIRATIRLRRRRRVRIRLHLQKRVSRRYETLDAR